MKKIIQKILPVFTAILMGIGLVAPALSAELAYAEGEGEVRKAQVTILTTCRDEENGSGESIACVVRFVADILSVLIGIAGVIGIVVVGIQYLTAGGNEETTRKAKRRLFEIIIGIMVYVLIYAALRWLLPNFGAYTMPLSGV